MPSELPGAGTRWTGAHPEAPGRAPGPAGGGAAAGLPAAALIRPRWAAPSGVGALMTTRAGGVSRGEWASLNLGRSVGDAPEAVAENRRRFAASLRREGAAADASGEPAARPVWLQQVHGNRLIELGACTPEQAPEPADAAWTRVPGIACVVGAADCLPVLLAARDGRTVAAVHAGWRGLAAGVLDNTVRALVEAAVVRPADLLAWLGPCIGPRRFEVGADVLQAFGHEAADPSARLTCGQGAGPSAPPRTGHFTFRPRADGSPRWLAHLQGLARERLLRLGVTEISSDGACTYEESSRLFSFRRDGRSGRMAAAIWIDG